MTIPSFARLQDRLRAVADEGAADATRAMEQGATGSLALALGNRNTAAKTIARKIASVLEKRA